MKIEELSANERVNIYNNYMTFDFHKSELKTFDLIESLVEKDSYVCFGFYEDTELLGYAYFIKSKTLLLDYFAVNKQYRSNGLGSKLLEDIKNKFYGEYSLLLAEVENPEYANDNNDRDTRERRIKFYLKNGFKLSNIKSHVLTDDYMIMTLNLGKELDDKEIYQEMNLIYRTSFGEAFFKKHINVLV